MEMDSVESGSEPVRGDGGGGVVSHRRRQGQSRKRSSIGISTGITGCCSPCFTNFQHWKMMLLFAGVNFIDAMMYSIPSAFYPKEAELKGVSSSEYGFVFGIYELTEFITTPLVANFMYKTTPKRLFLTGVLINGTSVVLFGLLELVYDHITFFLLSLLLRVVESASSGLMLVAAFTIVTDNKPESATQAVAVMELVFGVGFSTGPIVGEGLYLLGGFKFPFIVLGGVFLVSGLLISMCFCFDEPPEREQPQSKNGPSDEDHSKGILALYCIPIVLLQCFAIIVDHVCFSFLLTVLEPHLREFDLQPMGIGMAFFLNGALCAIFMPIFAKISECMARMEYMQLLGGVLELMAAILVGPAPFLRLESGVKWVMIGLVLNGIGVAAIYISAFVITLQEAKAAGCRDPHAFVSAIWMSCKTLGSFLGASAAGVLTDHFGFPRATYMLQALSLTLIVLVVGRLLLQSQCCGCERGQDSHAHAETKPLLLPASTTTEIQTTSVPDE